VFIQLRELISYATEQRNKSEQENKIGN
jgi:hypothetical protein